MDVLLAMEREEILKAFGARLKELRKQKGWTQKELGGRVEIRFSQLNKYESGLHTHRQRSSSSSPTSSAPPSTTSSPETAPKRRPSTAHACSIGSGPSKGFRPRTKKPSSDSSTP